MIAVKCTIKLMEPLLATGLEGDPNAKRSLDYIPGSALRGAAIGRELTQSGRQRLDEQNDDDRRLFLSDTTRFLNAYPLLKRESVSYRTLPTPKSWQRDKTKALDLDPTIFDLAVLAPAEMDAQVQYKGLDRSFCWQVETEEADYAYLPEVERSIRMHTARERRAGRATRQEGALFQYDALAAGQEYIGIILASTQEDAGKLAALLQGDALHLGGSRSAGYGAVQIATAVAQDWPGETPAITQDLPAGEVVRLTSLSPWLLTIGDGQAATMLEAADLAKLLGVAAGHVQRLDAQTWRETTTIGGFNQAWGLPLAQTVAIAAGSVFTYRLDAPVPKDGLQRLQESGIGVRRGEGFGRVAVNWQKAPRLAYAPPPEKDTPPEKNTPPPEYEALLRVMGERLLREEADQALAKRVRQLILADRNAISNSLNGRLRAAIRSGLGQAQANEEALTPLRQLLADLKPKASNQLHTARLKAGNVRVLDWMNERLANSAEIWNEFDKLQAVTWGTLEIKPPEAWSAEYALRLIDGVLAQAARRPKE